ncbi:putative MSHA pilin protein MshC [Vibrio nigripulchritudo SO65]|uniref:prepilin-type N-terminal cleavage/methylation domain-containing protein n=1 Tax=Vibrio nigripulchritudo TaxID=28173 RepID=UPI0003B18446|nr:prepilin-type N-terminal cleavage/methylation domain-containing protein [Vibrio nigripulchritudo]CCN37941.1 putative MSHA pilin protein MshC [Vibrio nigripulchritudo AM115]CCN38959.1 putative MSHA pilin protein MshC [Vibrio nigripulchritudo FTn2]CCN64059.1 putative MSHA pilin protein MshC [Vibrio nigripulchritudo POn4]CCN76426.1 putative MSHA pilin protein MshC [Vibrio nigripulchritudo SO65]
MQTSLRSHQGFTLTELVVVIVLLGIVSTYAASRYSGASDFSAYAAQEQAISIIRQIQLGRMQSNLPSLDYSGNQSQYRLQVSGNCLGTGDGCNANNRSNYVLVEDQTFSFTPSSLIVEFDLLGRPICVSGCTTPSVGGNISINISNGLDSATVCINSEGFVHDSC